MVNFLGLLTLLFSLNSFAAVLPSGAPSVALGVTAQTPLGQATVGLSDLHLNTGGVFAIHVNTSSDSAAEAYPFKRDGVAYQVTTGSSAYCFAGTYTGDTNNVYWGLVSATASFADSTAVGSLTGPVYQTASATIGMYRILTANINVYLPMHGMYVFKSATFPGINVINAGGVMVTMHCREVVN